MNSVVVHYKELALKGRNRPWFIQLLVRNLRRALAGFDIASIRFVMGRIEIQLGRDVAWTDDLDRAELTIHIEMLPDYAFYFFGKEPGAGGLPTGTGGRLACLLSGGIDSPVAAFKMMRRGCSVLLIHFHSYPILSRASQEKVREIAALLTKHQLRSPLVLVPFGELQQQVVLAVPPALRVVVYRRLMMRIAEKLARRWRARALVTGEVIGQVASQTLDNLTTIAEATTMEVLRPLVGMDKDEIAAEAERLGT